MGLVSEGVGLARVSGTTILLLHNGLPRTPFYAQRHLKGLLDNAFFPSVLSSFIAQYRCRQPIITQCLESAGQLDLAERHRRFGKTLSTSLNAVLPEFRPFSVEVAYIYEEPFASEVIPKIVDSGTDRLIALSTHAFPLRHVTKTMEKICLSVLEKETTKVPKSLSDRWTFISKSNPISFDFDLNLRIGCQRSIIQYWAERLAKNMDQFDSVIFAVALPSPFEYRAYADNVFEVAKRSMYAFYQQYPRAVPFRVAFYPSWDHYHPTYSITRNIKSVVRSLKKFGRAKPLVIPFDSLFKDFNSEIILPKIVSMTDGQVLKPDDLIDDKSLNHSFVEMIKTEMLTISERSINAEPLL